MGSKVGTAFKIFIGCLYMVSLATMGLLLLLAGIIDIFKENTKTAVMIVGKRIKVKH